MNEYAFYIATIGKIGSSDGIVIPKPILKSYGWVRGDKVVFGFAKGNQLYVRKLTPDELKSIKPDIITIE